MDVTAIPFNRFLGLRADQGTVTLPADSNYLNHVGTVHASAQFALAEAASGEWLLSRFSDAAEEYAAVVRRAEVKFRRPANGELRAEAEVAADEAARFLDALSQRGRGAIEVRVRLLDSGDTVTLEAVFEWFAQRARGDSRSPFVPRS